MSIKNLNSELKVATIKSHLSIGKKGFVVIFFIILLSFGRIGGSMVTSSGKTLSTVSLISQALKYNLTVRQ